jgi:hypothetical protein
MLLCLDSQLGKCPARVRRLVAKPRELELLLAGLSTKSSDLRVDGPVFGHKLSSTKRQPLGLGTAPPTRAGDAVTIGACRIRILLLRLTVGRSNVDGRRARFSFAWQGALCRRSTAAALGLGRDLGLASDTGHRGEPPAADRERERADGERGRGQSVGEIGVRGLEQ